MTLRRGDIADAAVPVFMRAFKILGAEEVRLGSGLTVRG
jgi:hypothetical protein